LWFLKPLWACRLMIVFPLQRDSGACAARNFGFTTIRVPPHDLPHVRERIVILASRKFATYAVTEEVLAIRVRPRTPLRCEDPEDVWNAGLQAALGQWNQKRFGGRNVDNSANEQCKRQLLFRCEYGVPIFHR